MGYQFPSRKRRIRTGVKLNIDSLGTHGLNFNERNSVETLRRVKVTRGCHSKPGYGKIEIVVVHNRNIFQYIGNII